VIYHYYWFRDQSKTKEISGNTALHYFRNQDPGAFVSLSGGGVLASSDKQDQAQQFIRFITGRAGQEVLEKGTSFEYPVASGVPANPALPPLASLQAPAVDPSTLDAQKVSDLMTKDGLL
jgi:iron(III) transport system substrate-binding protein